MPEIEVTPEHASDPLTRRVGILVGVVGILLSVVTISSHRAHTQAVIHRTESNDQWAFYQAKKIRESTNDVALTLLQALGTDASKNDATTHKLTAARDKYADEAREIMKEAEAKDVEQKIEERRALRFPDEGVNLALRRGERPADRQRARHVGGVERDRFDAGVEQEQIPHLDAPVVAHPMQDARIGT